MTIYAWAQRADLASKLQAVGSLAALACAYHAVRSLGADTRPDLRFLPSKAAADAGNAGNAGSKGGYWRGVYRLVRLLRIMAPKLCSSETLAALAVAVLLVVRTWIDVRMLHLTTTVERHIVSRNGSKFFSSVADFVLFMVPVACATSLLKYAETELQLLFRTRLSRHLYDRYLRGQAYYQLSLDPRAHTVDQLLTHDVEHLCESIVELYSDVLKPIFDIVTYSWRLSSSMGTVAPSTMVGYLLLSGGWMSSLRIPTGEFTASTQRQEGEFRYINSRFAANTEEIAFYNGAQREYGAIWQSFERLINLIRRSQQFRFSMNVLDSTFAKYFSTVVGWLLVADPFIDLSNPTYQNATPEQLYQNYHTKAKMMINLAAALGRLILSGREFARLVGFAERIVEFDELLDQRPKGEVEEEGEVQQQQQEGSAATGTWTIEEDVIAFENVQLVTPTNDVLIKSLSFRIKKGTHLMICGPNGCGKSSLFRVLGGLWPVHSGHVIRPPRSQLFYLPQKPYMPLGSLRDQIIYPDTEADMVEKGMTDADLQLLLNQVHLPDLVAREGGLDVINNWNEVLSGGEKQRLVIARVLYHKPTFAILDECTSAVSHVMEAVLYKEMLAAGITLVTVSHRHALWAHHDYVLQFDGQGGYSFTRAEHAERMYS